MGDTFNIGTFQAGNASVGGSGNTVGGEGKVENRAPVGADPVAELRARLDELAARVAEHADRLPPGTAEAVAEARAEAAGDAPEPGRMRALVGRVVRGSEGVGAVTGAAVSVHEAIGLLPF
ncbi:hypothetical protein ACQEU3_25290 [Spirillospora sp. CA-253888]